MCTVQLLRADGLQPHVLTSTLQVHINLYVDRLRSPELPVFTRSHCTVLRSLHLNGYDDYPDEHDTHVGRAYLEAAADALPPLQLEELVCESFLPSRAPPPGLVRLVVKEVECEPGDLELLLLRCSSLGSCLQELSLMGVDGDNMRLSSDSLQGLHLPALQALNLHLCTTSMAELSWLACPRTFVLSMYLEDTRVDSEHWTRLLHGLKAAGVLKLQDQLTLDLGSSCLSLAGQEELGTMQLAVVRLVLPPQAVQLLPAVP